MSPACPFSSSSEDAAFSGLNLHLELKNPAQMPDLLRLLQSLEDEIRFRMKRLNSVHYARFLPTRDNAALQVITEYDGELDDYLQDFIIEIGDIFNAMLGFVRDAPPLPIQGDPEAFFAFVRRNNCITVDPLDPREVSVFSAYRRKTVLEINGQDQPEPIEQQWWAAHAARQALLADAINAPDPAEADVPLDDVQANLLAPLRTSHAHHFALALGEPARARTFLLTLLDGGDSGPTLSSQASVGQASGATADRKGLPATDPSAATAPALTLGLTAPGLLALGLPQTLLSRFPQAYREGPILRARGNHDLGVHAPESWLLGGPDQVVHLLLSLHEAATADHGAADHGAAGHGTRGQNTASQGAAAAAAFERSRSALLRQIETAGLTVVHEQEVRLLDGNGYHFGFRDGISQPALARSGQARHDEDLRAPGVAPLARASETHQDANAGSHGADDDSAFNGDLPRSRVGEFLLGAGYRNGYDAPSLGRLPAALAENGSFAVVRLLQQDAEGFERMLDEASEREQLCREYLAAKLLGRWRNGAALSEAGPPATCQGAGCRSCPPPPLRLNDFDFRHRLNGATSVAADDYAGQVCPVGSHVRRMTPRRARAAGKPDRHRVIRRGLPWGPAWQRGRPDEQTRGLYGVFYCGSIAQQFEFLQRRWGYDGRQRGDEAGRGDPFCGASGAGNTGGARAASAGASAAGFQFPLGDRRVALNWTQLVRTRGCLYLFMPGLAALRRLASTPASLESAGKPAGAALQEQVERPACPAAPASARRRRGPAAPTETLDPADLERFNPMHPAFIADPYPYYAQFRDRARVARLRYGSGYSRIWVFGRAEVEAVCANDRLFGKPLAGWPRYGHQDAADPAERFDRGLFYLDGPRHLAASQALYPALHSAIVGIESTARQLADQALRQIRTHEFDAIPSYVNRVTRDVFLTLLGVPAARWSQYGTSLETMLYHYNPLNSPAERAPYGVALRALLGEMTTLCPLHQGRDLYSLIGTADHGLNPVETLQTALHFALGGYLSTAFALGTGIRRLLTDRAARAAFDDPLTRPTVIQELLRHDPPFQTAERRATRDGELGGVRFQAGEILTVVFGSANRDPVRAEGWDPSVAHFDPTRPAGAWTSNPAFGSGVHRCIGVAMVEKVLPIYLERWLAAMPTLALGEAAPRWIGDPAYRGYASLPLRF